MYCTQFTKSGLWQKLETSRELHTTYPISSIQYVWFKKASKSRGWEKQKYKRKKKEEEVKQKKNKKQSEVEKKEEEKR